MNRFKLNECAPGQRASLRARESGLRGDVQTEGQIAEPIEVRRRIAASHQPAAARESAGFPRWCRPRRQVDNRLHTAGGCHSGTGRGVFSRHTGDRRRCPADLARRRARATPKKPAALRSSVSVRPIHLAARQLARIPSRRPNTRPAGTSRTSDHDRRATTAR